jgi:hypothetical protein
VKKDREGWPKDGGQTAQGFDKTTFQKHFAVRLMVLRARNSGLRLTLGTLIIFTAKKRTSEQACYAWSRTRILLTQTHFLCGAEVKD